jgi:hypothetical protein
MKSQDEHKTHKRNGSFFIRNHLSSTMPQVPPAMLLKFSERVGWGVMSVMMGGSAWTIRAYNNGKREKDLVVAATATSMMNAALGAAFGPAGFFSVCCFSVLAGI